MPTFLLLIAVLFGRFVLALWRGVVLVVLLPARTAMAVAPYVARPRWLLAGGATASLALVAMALVALLLGGTR